MAVYLAQYPPVHRQFFNPRRSKPSGAIVVHTAEGPADFSPPDDGAEAIARFIQSRGDAGSYHVVVDSDGAIQLGEYSWEMFGEGTGGNRWALHLAGACRTTDWQTNATWTHNVLWNLAAEARAMAQWCRAVHQVVIPARRITAAEYRAGQPGFIPHADVDPARRTDPGATFPWDEFFSFYSQGGTPVPAAANTWSMNDAQATLDNLTAVYVALTGSPPNAADQKGWGKDLIDKLSKGVNPHPTLDYIRFLLEGGKPA